MNTRKIAAEYRLAHWTQIMHRKRESGLSAKAFCENEGIHENVYYYWQQKLRSAACEQMAEMQSEQVERKLVPSGFAELKIVKAYDRQCSQNMLRRAKFALILPVYEFLRTVHIRQRRSPHCLVYLNNHAEFRG